MSCFRPKTPKTLPQENQETKNVIHEVLLSVPGCKVHLMEEGEAVELDTGDFTLFRVTDDSAVLATTVKVGDLQWPLTKDEPVVKLDALHYLFSLPVKDGEPFSYGVTFLGGGNLGLLDSFLNEHSCFSCSSSSASSSNRNKDVNWKEYAPAIQDYNNFLAKAIAGGTGQIVKGIFKCSNAYTNQSVLGIILGGGAGTRLYPLTKKRAKPAVPLGANYHLIDIPAYASNMGGYKNEGFVEVLAARQSPENPNWFQFQSLKND